MRDQSRAGARRRPKAEGPAHGPGGLSPGFRIRLAGQAGISTPKKIFGNRSRPGGRGLARLRFAWLNYARSPGRECRSCRTIRVERARRRRCFDACSKPYRGLADRIVAAIRHSPGISQHQMPSIRRTHARADRDFPAVSRGSPRDVVVKLNLSGFTSCDSCPRRCDAIHKVPVWEFRFVDTAWLRGTGFEFRVGADGTMPSNHRAEAWLRCWAGAAGWFAKLADALTGNAPCA
jgi:hypothetical protein